MTSPATPAPAKFTFKPVQPPAAATLVDDKNLAAAGAKPVTPVATPATVPSTDAAPAPVPTVPTSAPAVIPPANGAVAEYRPPASYGDDADQTGANDIIVPRINIVQKVGDLSNQFTEGDIILNGQLVIARSVKGRVGPVDPANGNKPSPASPETIRVIIAGFRPDRYVEKTDGQTRGEIVDSEQQVYAKGGTLNYNEAKQTGKKLYQTLAECVALIEKPENCQDDTSFPYVADGKLYAVVKWSFKGGAYTNGAKVLRTARKAGWLADVINPATGEVTAKRGYPFGFWKVNTVLKSYDTGNFSWNPNFVRDGDTTDGVRALALKAIES